MGLFDGGLFGSSGGQFANRDIARLTRNLASRINSEFGQPADVYSGPIAPGINPQIEAALAGASGLLAPNEDVSGALSQLLAGPGDQQAVRDFYESSVLAPAQQAFGDQLQQIGDVYGSTWGTSGAMPRMVADATSRFGTGLGSVLGELVYNDRNAALDRLGTGVGLSLANNQNQAQNLQTVLGLGDYSRGIAGEQNMEAYNKWLAGQEYNNPWLGFLGTALSTAQPTAPEAGALEKGIGLFRTILPF